MIKRLKKGKWKNTVFYIQMNHFIPGHQQSSSRTAWLILHTSTCHNKSQEKYADCAKFTALFTEALLFKC